jgi:excisionase family DNA binding protein
MTEGRMGTEQPDILTVAEVAKWLRVSEGWVRHHANGTRRPKLPAIKLGKRLVFRRSSVEEFLRQYEEIASKEVA